MTAVVSIVHRLSGVILFVAVAPLIYLYAMSLRSEADYQALLALLDTPLLRLLVLFGLLMLLQHLVSGIRFLLLDLDLGLEKQTARATAWSVFIAVGLLFILLLVGIGR